MPNVFFSTEAGTSQTATSNTTTTSGAYEIVSFAGLPVAKRKNDRPETENAVYAYIQAMRGLGRNTINTVEIAKALHLSVPVVHSAIAKLQSKGVKLAGVSR